MYSHVVIPVIITTLVTTFATLLIITDRSMNRIGIITDTVDSSSLEEEVPEQARIMMAAMRIAIPIVCLKLRVSLNRKKQMTPVTKAISELRLNIALTLTEAALAAVTIKV